MAALVTGVLAVVLLITGPQLLALVLGGVAVVAGIIGYRTYVIAEKETAGQGASLTGMIMGAVPIIAAVIALIPSAAGDALYQAPRTQSGGFMGEHHGINALDFSVGELQPGKTTWSVRVTVANRDPDDFDLSALRITASVDAKPAEPVPDKSALKELTSGQRRGGDERSVVVTFSGATGSRSQYEVSLWPRTTDSEVIFTGVA